MHIYMYILFYKGRGTCVHVNKIYDYYSKLIRVDRFVESPHSTIVIINMFPLGPKNNSTCEIAVNKLLINNKQNSHLYTHKTRLLLYMYNIMHVGGHEAY